MESELFGHEKGAFTDACSIKNGLVEAADTGTLFLDEVGEMPQALQTKLLRFLDSGEFRRVGANKNLKADVRIITATNKDLTQSVARGDFRKDLFFRLNVINIMLPPLRERESDIQPLAHYFLEKYSQRITKKISSIDPGAVEVLLGYNWPGNVRELENVIERATILCDFDIITKENLSITRKMSHDNGNEILQLKEVEKDYILNVLKKTGGNQTKASMLLGVDRKTLYLKLKKYGLTL